MSVLVACIVLVAQAQDPGTAVFKDEKLNLQFSYPKTWRIEKRDKRQTVMTIPLPDLNATARLEIIHAGFRGDPDTWQTIQQRSNELDNRTVVRQYQQELLGAPLLLTQVEFTEKGIASTRLTGLHYSRNADKMLFNLTASTAVFDSVSYLWQQTMESFRTISGENLATEDPTVKPPTKPATPVAAPLIKRPLPERPGATSAERTQVVTVGGERPTQISLSREWTAKTAEDGTITLTRKDIPGAVTLQVGAMADSTMGSQALTNAANAALAQFAKVEIRQDLEPTNIANGPVIASVYRRGMVADVRRVIYHGVSSGISSYALIGYDAPVKGEESRVAKALQELLESIRFPEAK